MIAEVFLARLDGVRRTGPGRWIARCPGHDDRRPSLNIRELGDGRVLLHDFGGCATVEVLEAVGLTFADLLPGGERIDHRAKRERQPFPAMDVLRAVSFEVDVVAIAATMISQGEPLSEVDRQRVMVAAQRLREAAHLAGVSDA